MKFKLSEKHNCIFVKITLTESGGPGFFLSKMDSLSEKIEEAYRENNLTVVFDLLGTNFIDSFLISILVQTFRLTAPEKNKILTTDEQILDIITLIGIDKMFDVYDSEEEWLNDDSSTELPNQ